MAAAEAAWTTGLIVLPLVALLAFLRRRMRTVDYAESRAVKANLPWWVKNIEVLVMFAFGYLFAKAGFRLFVLLTRGRTAAGVPFAGAEAVYVVLGLAFIILPTAMLCANATSWLTPFLRRANDEAFRGTHASFKSSNAGLLGFAAVSVPFGTAALLIAAIEPWTR